MPQETQHRMFYISSNPEIKFPNEQPGIFLGGDRVSGMKELEQITDKDHIIFDADYRQGITLEDILKAKASGYLRGDLFVYQHSGTPEDFFRKAKEAYEAGAVGFIHGSSNGKPIDIPILLRMPEYFDHLRNKGFVNGQGITIRSFKNILLLDIDKSVTAKEIADLILVDTTQNCAIIKVNPPQNEMVGLMAGINELQPLTSVVIPGHVQGKSYDFLGHVVKEFASRSRYPFNWVSAYNVPNIVMRRENTFIAGNREMLEDAVRNVFPKYVAAGIPNEERFLKAIVDMMHLVYSRLSGSQYLLIEDDAELLPDADKTEFHQRIKAVMVGKIGAQNVPIQLAPKSGGLIFMSETFIRYFFYPARGNEGVSEPINTGPLYFLPPAAIKELKIDGDVATAEGWKGNSVKEPYLHRTRIYAGNEAVARYLTENFGFKIPINPEPMRFIHDVSAAVGNWVSSQKR